MFESLRRRDRPNDALACPPDLCPVEIDILPPEFAVELSVAARGVRAGDLPGTSPHPGRYRRPDVNRPLCSAERRECVFPDTIVVRFLERPGGRSTIAIYSRSQLGYADMGVNLARIERWLEKLEPRSGRSQTRLAADRFASFHFDATDLIRIECCRGGLVAYSNARAAAG